MNRKIALNIFSLLFLLIPLISFAATTDTPPTRTTDTPPTQTTAPTKSFKISIPSPLKSGVNDIPSLIKLLISSVVVPVGGIIAVLMIMYAGFLFVTANGNTGQLQKAKDTLLYTAIGAAILIGAEVLANVVTETATQLGTP